MGDELSLAITALGLQAHQKSLLHDNTISMDSVITSFSGIMAGCVGELTFSLENGAGLCSSTRKFLHTQPLVTLCFGVEAHLSTIRQLILLCLPSLVRKKNIIMHHVKSQTAWV